jgi:DNA-binding transcriptional LysR family regulator
VSSEPQPKLVDLYRFRLICEAIGMHEGLPDDEEIAPFSWHSLIEKDAGYEPLRGLNQTTLTDCIGRLENVAGGGLFVDEAWSKHRITPKGRTYYRLTVRLLEIHEQLGHAPVADSVPRMSVVLGGYNSLLASHVPAALRPYFEKMEAGDAPYILFSFREDTLLNLVSAVEGRTVAFAVASVPGKDLDKIEREVVVSRLGYKVERGVILPPKHKLGLKRRVTLKDLHPEWVFRLPIDGAGSSPREWLRSVLTEGGKVTEVTHFNVALQWVKLGVGVATVPYLPGEIADAVKTEAVLYRSLSELEQAEIALFLPRGGKAALTTEGQIVHDVIESYFKNNAKNSPMRP